MKSFVFVSYSNLIYVVCFRHSPQQAVNIWQLHTPSAIALSSLLSYPIMSLFHIYFYLSIINVFTATAIDVVAADPQYFAGHYISAVL